MTTNTDKLAQDVPARFASPAERAPAPTVAEPVMTYLGRHTMDCGEHGSHNMEMHKLIPAGTKLYDHAAPTAQEASKPVQAEAPGEDADPLTPEQEEWVMDLAEKHNLGRRIGQIAAMRGKYPDVFYTDASYRTHELFCFAAELLATQPPAIPAAPAVQASGELLAWIEKVGSVRIERVRAGFKGPIRWDIEYGPHEDEARGDTLQDAIRAALASPPAINPPKGE